MPLTVLIGVVEAVLRLDMSNVPHEIEKSDAGSLALTKTLRNPTPNSNKVVITVCGHSEIYIFFFAFNHICCFFNTK